MPESGYQVLNSDREEEVHFQFTPNVARTRWNHIEDLDTFFTRIYLYHQRHGFICLILQAALDLLQVVFLLVFSLFLFYCIDYPVLFRDKPVDSGKGVNTTDKVKISDVILPASKCISHFTFLTYLYMLPLLIFVIFRLMKLFSVAYHYADIKAFYNIALHIPDKELENYTWREIILKVINAQKEQHMCIHKLELTELDIYQRILRTKNYLIALLNKSVLPTQFNIPLIGDTVYFSHGMKYNLNLLLFWGPWSPFENNWHLKPEYKQPGKRLELAESMRKAIGWVAFVNLLLCPVVFTWQLIYKLCDNAQIIKNEPSVLSVRIWSLYSKIYLRHFNELDHELSARLSRAYVPATKYLQSFGAPISVIIAKNTMFFTSAIMVPILVLTVYDDSILTIEHMITILSGLSLLFIICRGLVDDEKEIVCQESLLTAVLAEVHYLPDSWVGKAHTQQVSNQFSQIFPFKANYLINELISPLVTPFILYFWLRPKALEIVDFYRNYTADVAGVGDVCAFSMMNLRKNGNPAWRSPGFITTDNPLSKLPQVDQAEDGKVEMSLLNFSVRNPTWDPVDIEAKEFVEEIIAKTRKVYSSSDIDIDPIIQHEILNSNLHIADIPSCLLGLDQSTRLLHKEGLTGRPNRLNSSSIMRSSIFTTSDYSASMELNQSALLLHNIHRKQLEERGNISNTSVIQSTSQKSNTSVQERTPLLKPNPRIV
ncbi:autophagy-related protein 9A-like [Daktulosphaira vitifoliae]|uniref:autophagy-related protein 9A-like n=2 Tax=Daktulosphaira vitifoliae TaxID=58002 RepID=UPI0021AA4328|nr:autophagy-related protein 9A-like [Daktulosphaira vitifoliae]XP_050533948.1 autophagy-related protein 9A-like [Daktulosphaira vitifoliae]